MLTDAEINRIIKAPKYLSNKVDLKSLSKTEDGAHYIKSVKLECESFNCTMRIRQSIIRPTNFSVILVYRDVNKNDHVILRFNGNHGRHKNRIEKDEVDGPHIHIMTERYQLKTTHPDGYAQATSEYKDLDGAIESFMKMANIQYR